MHVHNYEITIVRLNFHNRCTSSLLFAMHRLSHDELLKENFQVGCTGNSEKGTKSFVNESALY